MIPVAFTWQRIQMLDEAGVITEADVMVPLRRFANVCASQFDLEQVYTLEVVGAKGERTDRSHKHYMACVTAAWRTLPENMANDYPTPNHLRKRALIKCKYYHLKSIVFDTPADANRAAAYIKPMDEFAVVLVEGKCVNHYTAKSQKYLRAGGMGKEEFQKSKDDVLYCITEMIKVKKDELEKAAEKYDV